LTSRAFHEKALQAISEIHFSILFRAAACGKSLLIRGDRGSGFHAASSAPAAGHDLIRL
jgi:hypothetical protein